MDEVERWLRIALWMIPGITGEHLAAMVSRHGSFSRALEVPRCQLAATLGLPPAAARLFVEAPADLLGWIRSMERDLAGRGGRFLVHGEAGYPELPHLPLRAEVLALRGELAGAGSGRLPKAVAIIGSRKADPGALRMARRMAGALVEAGFTVVSGGAIGVDAAAHHGAVEAGGATVAVLGSGVLCPDPSSNRRLFASMLENGGGLLSEMPPRQRASSWHFPRRNRLIAALARAVVVVRASARSGCAHTVEAARGFGRPVFVVPAPELGERSAGGQAWLEAGADPVENEAALLERLGVCREPEEEEVHLSPEERQVLDALSSVPAPLLLLAGETGLGPGNVARIIAELCGRGLVRPQGPGCFVRS